MKPLRIYENATDILNTDILQEDEITFSMLQRIVNGGCQKVITDGERSIIALSHPVFPVWVWTKKDATEEEISALRESLQKHFPLEEGYTYNLSRELWEKLGLSGRIQTNMLSYRLDCLGEPPHPCGGFLRLAKEGDIPALTPWLCELNHWQEGVAEQSLREKIEQNTLFVWCDEREIPVSMASALKQDNGYATVSTVFTHSGERRKGYCQNLVYRICESLLREGYAPILYADADYPASNGCYRKIGFRTVGSLCNVTK